MYRRVHIYGDDPDDVDGRAAEDGHTGADDEAGGGQKRRYAQQSTRISARLNGLAREALNNTSCADYGLVPVIKALTQTNQKQSWCLIKVWPRRARTETLCCVTARLWSERRLGKPCKKQLLSVR